MTHQSEPFAWQRAPHRLVLVRSLLGHYPVCMVTKTLLALVRHNLWFTRMDRRGVACVLRCYLWERVSRSDVVHHTLRTRLLPWSGPRCPGTS